MVSKECSIPFGSPVEPDENKIKHISFGLTFGYFIFLLFLTGEIKLSK